MKQFYRKQFSNYLGEQRAILDIVIGFSPNPSPTPLPLTPTPTPSATSTPTPTPTPTTTSSLTPTPTTTITQTPTNTGTPTPTPTKSPLPVYSTELYLISPYGFNLSATTASTITYNSGTSYNFNTSISTIEYAACSVMVEAPALSNVYSFELGNLPVGWEETTGNGSGSNNNLVWDKITYTITNSGIGGVFSADIRYYYNGVQVGTTATNGAVYYPNTLPSVCGSQIGFSLVEFYVSEQMGLLAENSDNINTENNDRLDYNLPRFF